ncbi:uncharacterized protein LOC115023978 [Cottoperca gobio]|uniref:Uncharacterized protein LOC115023978 n=1 Tax=Cottoperca gobio TaxID=56716 RepID=A0A6J2RJU3_COTGO|nr:uncharacterized protein LOC115023978 [Cottoperca gobio]
MSHSLLPTPEHHLILHMIHLLAVIEPAEVNQDIGVISASVGDNVTLRCFYDSQVAMHFSWYRQTLGDSSTYFCGSSHSNIITFGEGVFLSVEGTNKIDQGPVSETIQPGGSVTLNCTVHTGSCDEEHSVYWFRQGSHQGILHTHGRRCKHISSTGSPSQSCVYHLQKTNLSSTDAGTYYCAVASCGEVLFGNGSKLFVKE